MTYRQRVSLFIVIDSCIVLSAIFLSRILVSTSYNMISTSIVITSFAILVSHHIFSFKFKLYKKAWEYASVGELLIICKSVSLSIITIGLVQLIFIQEIYFRVLVVMWILNILLIGGSRFGWRIYRDSILKNADIKKRTLIIGAGSAGIMVARQLNRTNDAKLFPVGFIDDDKKKHGLDILGIPVLGGVSKIERTVKELEIDNIVIAIPSLNKKQLNIIFSECTKTFAKTQILPMLEDLVIGKISINQFRDVRVEDLLGRKPVELDTGSIAEYITNKVVLVTGAGGSIGSEICRQISKFSPSKLLLFGHGESSIFSIEYELKESFQNTTIQFVPIIGDVQDLNKLIAVMRMYKPDVVYHAAAHKHVTLMEENPEEAIKNNLIGTINTANAASWNNVKTFVMISTDKAVNPTSVMGASKRLAEIVIQQIGYNCDTKFVAVRFGNVLGSRGSVIPLFKKQIEKGGPVTVTHPDMVRYFMTIPEASRLVIQAGAFAKGGEIFILDMGEPVKIVDLAQNLIKLSGNSIEDIGIVFTGIRPGEKLFEELLKDEEVTDNQIYPNIYIGKQTEPYLDEIEQLITDYMMLDKEELRKRILNLANNQMIDKALLSTT